MSQTCQNATLLEITCRGLYVLRIGNFDEQRHKKGSKIMFDTVYLNSGKHELHADNRF